MAGTVNLLIRAVLSILEAGIDDNTEQMSLRGQTTGFLGVNAST